ncbi:MAG: hypothetical protein SFU84_14455 [Gemmatimonadales bacterium]|nr:hypothetical protein [Gemmatimonadales bacterium]
MSGAMRGIWFIGLLLHPALMRAQGLCLPPTSSNEAKTMAILSVPVAFTAARAPAMPLRSWSVGLDVATLPQVDPEVARPTFCRPGKGPENTDPIPVVVRPRIAVALAGFVIEGAWTPPITLGGVRANLFGFAVSRPVRLADGVVLGVRAHAVFGGLNAPITCDEAALEDSGSECFRGTLSDDRWNPGVRGIEAVVGLGSRIRPYAGVGMSWLRPRFQVDFTNSVGDRDQRRVEVDLERVAVMVGVTAPLAGVEVTAEGYATVRDAMTARLVVRYR